MRRNWRMFCSIVAKVFVILQVSAIVSFLLGGKRAENIKIFAGDVVPRKKPDPVSITFASLS